MTNDKLADDIEDWLSAREHPYRTIKLMTDAIAALRRPCPYIVTDKKEGTSYCSLAERQPPSDKVMYALEESVKLQSHYANLLNMHDGGKRIGFENATAWLKRLAELAAAEAEGHHE